MKSLHITVLESACSYIVNYCNARRSIFIKYFHLKYFGMTLQCSDCVYFYAEFEVHVQSVHIMQWGAPLLGTQRSMSRKKLEAEHLFLYWLHKGNLKHLAKEGSANMFIGLEPVLDIFCYV